MKNSRITSLLLSCAFILSSLSPFHAAAAQTQKRGIRVKKHEQTQKPPIAGAQPTDAPPAAKHPAGGEAARTTETGKPRLVLQLGQRTMTFGFTAFSPDSRHVATGGGGDVVVWDVATGREVRRFGGNEGDPGAQDVDGLTGGAFSPDKRLMAVVAGPNLRLWNLSTGKLVWKRENASNAFLRRDGTNANVAFSADGRQIVVRGDLGTLTWDAATGRLANRVARKGGIGEGVTVEEMPRKSVSADGKFALTAEAGVVSVREKATGKESGRVRFKKVEGEEGDGLMAYALSPDGRVLATADRVDDEEESIRLWDLATGALLHRLEGRPAGENPSFGFNSEGELLHVSIDGELVRIREMLGGREVELNVEAAPGSFVISPDGRYVVTSAGRAGQVWDARTGAQLARIEAESEAEDFSWDFAGFTPDNTVTFYEDSETGKPQLVRLGVGDWKEKNVRNIDRMPLKSDNPRPFAMSHDTRAVAWEDVREVKKGKGDVDYVQQVTVWRAEGWYQKDEFAVDGDEAYHDPSDLALSPDGRQVLVVTSNNGGNVAQAIAKVWDVEEKRVLYKLAAPGFRVGAPAWSPDGRTLGTSDEGGSVKLWDAETGKHLRTLGGLNYGVEFSPDSRLILTSGSDKLRRIYDAQTGAEVCGFVAFADGDWLVVDPQGRFDANNLEELRGVHWVAPDDPLKPLPLELFMRDYYEPRLLARLLGGEKFSAVRSLAEINRLQPRVGITSIEPQKDKPDSVTVKVEVSKTKAEPGQDARAPARDSGVYDLRLFRDGQLVAYAPERGGEVSTDAQTGASVVTFENVRLPRRADVREVEFSAYAFNSDRVKSATARRSFRLARADAPAAPVKGRAYLVTVGVNAYENPAWDLRFAANDARRLQEVMGERLASGGGYSEVVRVPLVSDYETKDGKKSEPRVVSERGATKANFRAVLDLLAGKKVDPQALKDIPAAEQLRAATPEDLVIISFSSHGYADERGNFYLLPFDTGPGAEMGDVLGRAISSDELSAWLRDVDAGEMLLVVDACHSAASVQGPGFKPGPMGSRGLGQLSYDKGMRILTSTQADDVALESNLTEQGLLTYALTRDGIERARADFKPLDKAITVSEWLAYGVERVPALHAEVEKQLAEMRAGRAPSNSLDGGATQTKVVVFSARGDAPKADGAKGLNVQPAALKAQQPALFDFARKRRTTVIARTQ